jgi:hypothetical protein
VQELTIPPHLLRGPAPKDPRPQSLNQLLSIHAPRRTALCRTQDAQGVPVPPSWRAGTTALQRVSRTSSAPRAALYRNADFDNLRAIAGTDFELLETERWED